MGKNRVKRDDRAQGGVGDERKLEIDCCTYARQRGIVAVKIEKNAHKGIPDYMFIAEGGLTMFVEFKRPDGRGVVSNEQKYWAEFLGCSHRFVDNFEDFKKRLDDFFVQQSEQLCQYEPDNTTAMNCKHCGDPKWVHKCCSLA